MLKQNDKKGGSVEPKEPPGSATDYNNMSGPKAWKVSDPHRLIESRMSFRVAHQATVIEVCDGVG
jgi:hypothetical protein